MKSNFDAVVEYHIEEEYDDMREADHHSSTKSKVGRLKTPLKGEKYQSYYLMFDKTTTGLECFKVHRTWWVILPLNINTRVSYVVWVNLWLPHSSDSGLYSMVLIDLHPS